MEISENTEKKNAKSSQSNNIANNHTDHGEYTKNWKSAIPYDINDFIYSKKHHLEFFRDNYYDFDLYGNIYPDMDMEMDIVKYQNLLTYFFILKYIPEGSNILVIGKEYKFLFNRLLKMKRCTCRILNNPEDLNKADSTVKFSIENYNSIKESNISYIEYFNFIFTIGGFDNLFTETTEDENRNILYNLSRFLKPGGSILLNFSVLKHSNYFNFNNLIYSFYKEYNIYLTQVFPYNNPTEAVKDSELFYSRKTNTGNINEKKSAGSEDTHYMFSFCMLLKKQNPQISIKSVLTPGEYLKTNPAYFFHHLIKCGGSSLGTVLEKWFRFENDLYDQVETGGGISFNYGLDVNFFRKYKFNLENISSDTCIRGHFQHEGIYINQRYPEIFSRKDEFKVFTFVRDPLKVLYSLYYFGRKRNYDYQTISLKKYLESTKNFLAYLLQCNDDNYREILDRYFFIGIVDRMQESFDKLASLVGKKKITVPLFNTTEKDSQIQDLSPEFIEEIKKQNELDYKIYNYSLERFDKIKL